MWRLLGADGQVWHVPVGRWSVGRGVDASHILTPQDEIAVSKTHGEMHVQPVNGAPFSSAWQTNIPSSTLVFTDLSTRGTLVLPSNVHVRDSSAAPNSGGGAASRTTDGTAPRTATVARTVPEKLTSGIASPASVELHDGDVLILGAESIMRSDLAPRLPSDSVALRGPAATEVALAAWKAVAPTKRAGAAHTAGHAKYVLTVQWVPIVVCVSALPKEVLKAVKDRVAKVGAVVVNTWPEVRAQAGPGASGPAPLHAVPSPTSGVTHLVLGDLTHTPKFMRALFEGCWIVSPAWMAAVQSRGGPAAPWPGEAAYLPLFKGGIPLEQRRASLTAWSQSTPGGGSSAGPIVAPSGWPVDDFWWHAQLNPRPDRLHTVFPPGFAVVYDECTETANMLRQYGAAQPGLGLVIITLRPRTDSTSGEEAQAAAKEATADLQRLLPAWQSSAHAGFCPGVLVSGRPGDMQALPLELEGLRALLCVRGGQGEGAAGPASSARAVKSKGKGKASVAAQCNSTSGDGCGFVSLHETHVLHAVVACRPLPAVAEDYRAAKEAHAALSRRTQAVGTEHEQVDLEGEVEGEGDAVPPTTTIHPECTEETVEGRDAEEDVNASQEGSASGKARAHKRKRAAAAAAAEEEEEDGGAQGGRPAAHVNVKVEHSSPVPPSAPAARPSSAPLSLPWRSNKDVAEAQAKTVATPSVKGRDMAKTQADPILAVHDDIDTGVGMDEEGGREGEDTAKTAPSRASKTQAKKESTKASVIAHDLAESGEDDDDEVVDVDQRPLAEYEEEVDVAVGRARRDRARMVQGQETQDGWTDCAGGRAGPIDPEGISTPYQGVTGLGTSPPSRQWPVPHGLEAYYAAQGSGRTGKVFVKVPSLRYDSAGSKRSVHLHAPPVVRYASQAVGIEDEELARRLKEGQAAHDAAKRADDAMMMASMTGQGQVSTNVKGKRGAVGAGHPSILAAVYSKGKGVGAGAPDDDDDEPQNMGRASVARRVPAGVAVGGTAGLAVPHVAQSTVLPSSGWGLAQSHAPPHAATARRR